MIGRSNCDMRRILLSLLILSAIAVSLYSQDKHISGVINVYRRVIAIGPGLNNVTLSRIDSIGPGDTILLIQMKGAIIYELETSSYGSYRESMGAPGSNEFLIVQSVNSGTKNVIFTKNIIKSYNLTGIVQLIKVPSYNSAIVKADLTCQPWDSINKTGGVLALIVRKTLTLDANIDVTGKGFSGGVVTPGQGICLATNAATYDKFSYPLSYTNSGLKGESQAIKVFLSASNMPSYFPAYARGKGNNFTGGGGSNGRFSGGGGGSNYGVGGNGGKEVSTCTPSPGDGGIGGRQVKFTDLDGGLFLGGGGGASTFETGSTASPGSRGGGIIFIICDTLRGRGKSIKAEGATPITAASNNAGAGGGGGGGSIAIYQQSFSTQLANSALTISANGGKGGNNNGNFGEGGGGGGGLILTNNTYLPANVTKTVIGGTGGTRSGGSTSGTTGSVGESRTTFIPTLNGFLVNSISSSVTGNQIDSVCSNILPALIIGSTPVGGIAPYTYLWQRSTTSETAGYTNAPGINNGQDYSPGVLTQTTWIRRVITDGGSPAVTDYSKPVKIVVQQAITGNLVGKDTTICYNQNPHGLIPLNSGPANGNGTYEYRWIQNLTNTNWTTSPDAEGIINNPGYDPPNLTNTTFYKRVVTSGQCTNYSSTVTINVLPLITGNTTLRPDSVICEGSLFNILGSSSAGGGDLTYRYQWQDSITSSVWKPAAGINTGSDYSPDTSAFSANENRFFRRVVFSGPDNVCSDFSSPIHLIRYHKIKNNSILSDQTICSGNTPTPLTGSIPLQGKGPGSYTYIWQDSTTVSPWTAKGNTGSAFSPSALTDTTWYRRIVNSSKCTSKSLPVKVNVHKPIINNNVSLLAGGLSDTTVCSGAIPYLLKGSIAGGGTNLPGDYAYEWIYSVDNISWNPVSVSGTGINYKPPVLSATTYYRRRVISGACSAVSNTTIKITVLPLITNNVISSNQSAVCYNSAPGPITGATLSGGTGTYSFFWEQSTDGGNIWTPAIGINNLVSGTYQPPVLTNPVKYRRTVKSGANECCVSISNILVIGINPLPISTINAGRDTILFSFDNIIRLVATPPVATETGEWSVVSGTGNFENKTSNQTVVTNLSAGINTFLWSVTNGLCKLEDMVNVDVHKEFIPRGFSPNNDGLNDTFIITGLDLVNQTAELKIVNGAGTEVFSSSSRQGKIWNDWDGKNNRGMDLAEGTYYYLLKITTKRNGQVFKRSGFIVLKRY
jgi:gliding motility-associated-like protein